MIKIKLTRKDNKETSFPKLMIHKKTGSITLFTDGYSGTVLDGSDCGNNIGDHFNDFNKSNYVDYVGEVTLSNR